MGTMASDIHHRAPTMHRDVATRPENDDLRLACFFRAPERSTGLRKPGNTLRQCSDKTREFTRSLRAETDRLKVALPDIAEIDLPDRGN